MCAISGVLVMSLPIPIIAGNFEKFHKNLVSLPAACLALLCHQAKKNKLLKRRANLKEAKVEEEKVRMAELLGEDGASQAPAAKARSPVASLLTARYTTSYRDPYDFPPRTWSSRRGSRRRSTSPGPSR